MEDLFIKYENVKFDGSIDFPESDRLQDMYRNFKSTVNKYHNSKHAMCFYLNQLKELFDKYNDKVHIICNYSGLDGIFEYSTFAQFCKTFFNLEWKTVYRYIRVYDTFLKDYSKYFRDFNVSKLMELFVIEVEVLIKDIENKDLTPRMSLKEIRKYISSKKYGAVPCIEEEINEEEIPMAYDPSKHYEDEYFMGLAKSQLVNNIISLQEHCEKLQERIKELKKKKVV